jgi:hypothetical protein
MLRFFILYIYLLRTNEISLYISSLQTQIPIKLLLNKLIPQNKF